VVPLIGYYREVVSKGSQPVAYVDNQPISLDDFMKLYGFELINLDGQAQQMRQLAAQNPQSSSMFSQQIQRLETQRSSLDSTVLNEMLEQKIVAREAAARGITVSTADEDARIAKDFGGPEPTPAPTAAPDASPTPEGSPVVTPLATLAPIDRLRQGLANYKFMNEADYRALVVRPALLSEKLQDTFAKDVGATEPQIHARHILLETEDAAKAAKERLDKGESFEKLAAELSKDASNKDKGGDLGWFGKGKMTKPFEDAAFDLPVNQISEPVKTSFGAHIIQVLEKDDNHPLDDAAKTEKRNQLFKDWMEKQKDDGFANNSIRYEYSSDKVDWARAQVNKARGLPKNAE
jgi:foldase protein PrsA